MCTIASDAATPLARVLVIGTRRSTLLAVADHYRDMFGDDSGRIPATFQVLYLAGWCPHESQQQALKPGSGEVSLAAVLGESEAPD